MENDNSRSAGPQRKNGMFQFIRDWTDRHFSDPQILILSFLLVIGFIVIFKLGGMLIPVFVSLIFAYLLDGIVSKLAFLKIPRFAAFLIVFLLFLASLIMLTVGLLPLLSQQIAQLIQQFPAMISTGQNRLLGLPERYPGFISETQITYVLEFVSAEITTLMKRILSLSIASVRGFISVLVYLVIVPLMVFFLLKDKYKILHWVKSILPDQRGLANEVWREVNQQTGNYIRGKIWEILIIWGISYLTFKFLGMNFSMVLSLVVGLSVLVPYVGVTVVFLPVALFAYFQWGLTTEFFYALIAYSIIQLLDGNLLAPLLLSEVVDLHPVAIIVAVLLCGGLWGIWGLFFAIPLATLAHAVLKAVIKQSDAAKLAGEPAEDN